MEWQMKEKQNGVDSASQKFICGREGKASVGVWGWSGGRAGRGWLRGGGGGLEERGRVEESGVICQSLNKSHPLPPPPPPPLRKKVSV